MLWTHSSLRSHLTAADIATENMIGRSSHQRYVTTIHYVVCRWLTGHRLTQPSFCRSKSYEKKTMKISLLFCSYFHFHFNLYSYSYSYFLFSSSHSFITNLLLHFNHFSFSYSQHSYCHSAISILFSISISLFLFLSYLSSIIPVLILFSIPIATLIISFISLFLLSFQFNLIVTWILW